MVEGLSEHGPQRLICLDAGSPVNGSIWEGLGGVSLGMGSEGSKGPIVLVNFLCLCLMFMDEL